MSVAGDRSEEIETVREREREREREKERERESEGRERERRQQQEKHVMLFASDPDDLYFSALKAFVRLDTHATFPD
jgi:hypothetical protein